MNNNPRDQAETSSVPSTSSKVSAGAAQARVTGDELAQALALIEARREAEAQRSTDTIALGQAVEELGLEVTPEELLAEVRALRQKPAAPVAEILPEPSVQDSATVSTQGTTPVNGQVSPLTQCPSCSRRLLTQASALCNWCGAKIDDPKYQELAAQSRQQLDQSELSQLETMVQEETRYGIFGRLKRRAKSLGTKETLG